MKKILFILFTVQFILIPRITGSYGANSIGNNHGHSVTNQGKKTIKKDIFGDTVIEDNRGNRKSIKKISLEILSLKIIKVIKRPLRQIYSVINNRR